MERGKAGGEVRRINVVYFLSRNGKVEQPHLIRIPHFHRNSVRLRDVKRWLSELRGKDMPDLFTWSYKRRYKNGYVWQDLMDDDLITPISDDEYVLKGSSQVLLHKKKNCSFPQDEVLLSCGRIETDTHEETPSPVKKAAQGNTVETDSNVAVSEQRSPVTPRVEDDKDSPVPPPRCSDTSTDESNKRPALLIMEKLNKEFQKLKGGDHGNSSSEEIRRSFSLSGRKSASGSVLSNLLGCKVVDITGTVVQPISCKEHSVTAELGRRDGSFTAARHRYHKDNSRSRSSGGQGSKSIPAAHRPAREPHCSQCGRPFKPEKLHSHMKSCKALRERIIASRSRTTSIGN